MSAVGKAAFEVVKISRQFREILATIEGTVKPEYDRDVDIVTKAAMNEMTMPDFLNYLCPCLVEIFLGLKALAGLRIGLVEVGFMTALLMDNDGGAWDNVKN